MLTVEQVLKLGGKERRTIGRTRINRSALVFFHGQADVFPCCVRDATNSGAGIRLEGLNVLPVEFYLSFDRFRTARKCRLIWRELAFFGAAVYALAEGSPPQPNAHKGAYSILSSRLGGSSPFSSRIYFF